jgi:probable DNA metabolism protein
MMHLVYDETFSGFMTTVFEVYERKLQDVRIVKEKNFYPDVFSERISIVADEAKSLRVWNSLCKKVSITSSHNVYACFLSEIPGIENTILGFLRHVFSSEKNIESDYGHQETLAIARTARFVFREKHRMEAFVRFQRTIDDLYYAVIEPMYNVLPLLVTHFKNRYADQSWIIYDRRRARGIHYDTKTGIVAEIQLTFEEREVENSSGIFHEEEPLFQLLWKDYFHHVNIPSRKNLKLHLQHVPVRYWKHLTEKQL